MELQVLSQFSVLHVLHQKVESAFVLEAVVQLDEPGAFERGQHLSLDEHVMLFFFLVIKRYSRHVHFVHGLQSEDLLGVFLLDQVDFSV